MSAGIAWTGLDELRAELRNLPEDCAEDATDIVIGSAEAARNDVIQAYQSHQRSGRLIRGVRVTVRSNARSSRGAFVRSTAPHANLFENGSQARHTKIGANRGSMPPANIFIPIVMRWRRIMYDRLANMLRNRHGAIVTDVAA